MEIKVRCTRVQRAEVDSSVAFCIEGDARVHGRPPEQGHDLEVVFSRLGGAQDVPEWVPGEVYVLALQEP